MSEYIITTEQLNWFLERMDETVAIPAVIAHLKPLVRCKDCKRMRDWMANELASYNEIARFYDEAELADGWCMGFRIGTYDDFFCACGEREK